MRDLLLSVSMVLACLAQAQTYYYVNGITVTPPAPTTNDPVTITLNGDLSASSSYIIGTAHNVVGGQVQLTVNAGTQGIGLPVLVPHDEAFNLGTLAAGTYTITLSGTSMLDGAPAAQHTFTVTGGGGGSACDSLTLAPLTWHPFTDTALVLPVSNASSTLFDYPGFVLLNGQGDTLAQETVNYFGIGQGPQDHVLAVHTGAILPQVPFYGQLDLWTGFYVAQACTWSDTFDLCPPDPCAELVVDIGNFGGAIVVHTFPYTITDAGGATVASGTLTLDNLNQFTQDTVCLPPGTYTVNSSIAAVLGGQLIYGVGRGTLSGPHGPYVQGGVNNALTFTFFPACVSGTNGVEDLAARNALRAWSDGTALHLRTDDGTALGAVTVHDAQGRLIAHAMVPAASAVLPLRSATPGLLLIRTDNGTGRLVQRVILQP
ncbi:MAG: hypothetical protein JNL05_11015 [Flavobacteriales bacterium]|nr:hypothetical protein [Flavobacteriales bacterium]